MPASSGPVIVAEMKRSLREQGLTYTDVARVLELSLPSVKRLFSRSDLSLQRVDRVCELLGLELHELLQRAAVRSTPVRQLSHAQEQQLVADPKLLLVTWLVLNRHDAKDIVRDYALTEREVLRYLLQLDRLQVIELQPGNRARVLVSRHFSWRPGGPVQRFIHERLLKDFLAAPFTGEQELFYFHGGQLSETTLAELRRSLQHAARDCARIVDQERASDSAKRGAAFVLALRPWSYEGFRRFERTEALVAERTDAGQRRRK